MKSHFVDYIFSEKKKQKKEGNVCDTRSITAELFLMRQPLVLIRIEEKKYTGYSREFIE